VIKVSPPSRSHRVSCCANSTVQSNVISRERLQRTCPSTRSLLSVWQSKQCSSWYAIQSHIHIQRRRRSMKPCIPSKVLRLREIWFSRSEIAEDSSLGRDAMLLGVLFLTFRRTVVSSCSPSGSPRYFFSACAWTHQHSVTSQKNLRVCPTQSCSVSTESCYAMSRWLKIPVPFNFVVVWQRFEVTLCLLRQSKSGNPELMYISQTVSCHEVL